MCVQRKDVQPAASTAPQHRVKDKGRWLQSGYWLLGKSAAAGQGLPGKSKVGVWNPLFDPSTQVILHKKNNLPFLSTRLRERHQDVLRQKLFKLKQEQGVESEPLFPIIKQEMIDEDE